MKKRYKKRKNTISRSQDNGSIYKEFYIKNFSDVFLLKINRTLNIIEHRVSQSPELLKYHGAQSICDVYNN